MIFYPSPGCDIRLNERLSCTRRSTIKSVGSSSSLIPEMRPAFRDSVVEDSHPNAGPALKLEDTQKGPQPEDMSCFTLSHLLDLLTSITFTFMGWVFVSAPATSCTGETRARRRFQVLVLGMRYIQTFRKLNLFFGRRRSKSRRREMLLLVLSFV